MARTRCTMYSEHQTCSISYLIPQIQMNIALFNTAFSAGAILIPANKVDETPCTATPEATAFAAVMADNGYGLDQKLFRALCHLEAADIAAINEAVEEKLQLKLNWMPLIKGWTTPTLSLIHI